MAKSPKKEGGSIFTEWQWLSRVFAWGDVNFLRGAHAPSRVLFSALAENMRLLWMMDSLVVHPSHAARRDMEHARARVLPFSIGTYSLRENFRPRPLSHALRTLS